MPRRRRYRMATVRGKRVRVVRFQGADGHIVRWTASCSGCYETEDGHPVGHYPRDANGVVLQVLQWKGGSDDTVEARIDRILKLQNQPD